MAAPIAINPPVVNIAEDMDQQTPPQSPRAFNPKILWAPVKDTSQHQYNIDPEAIKRLTKVGRLLFDSK